MMFAWLYGENKKMFKQVQEDSRGSVSVMEFNGTDYLLVRTKRGYYRGGEIHKGRQYNVLLVGHQEWWIGEERKKFYAPVLIIVPSHTPHMMYSCSEIDSLMIEWREQPLENPVNYYRPFRKIVEASRNEEK